MMGYKGGELLLTGAAWPRVGSLPKPVCAGCGRWPGWPAAPVSDESALKVASTQDALYIYDVLPNLTLLKRTTALVNRTQPTKSPLA